MATLMFDLKKKNKQEAESLQTNRVMGQLANNNELLF